MLRATTALVTVAALLVLFHPGNWVIPAMAQTSMQAEMPDYENDPEWLAEQKQIEEDARQFMKDAEATERFLTGEPEPEEKVEASADGTGGDQAAAATQTADARRQTVVAIQTTLQAAGCYTMKVDGLWGPGSRRGVGEFARQQGLELDAQEPTPELAALLGENHSGGRVCPLVCDARHQPQGDTCVLKICPKGQVLDANGLCKAAPSGKTTGKATAKTQACPKGTGRAPDGRCLLIRNGYLCDPSVIVVDINKRRKLCRSFKNNRDWNIKMFGAAFYNVNNACNC